MTNSIQCTGMHERLHRRLAEGAHRAHAQDLDAASKLAGSSFREPDDASLSFKEAIIGPKEWARIRNRFGEYVPASVAAKMLAGDYVLEP